MSSDEPSLGRRITRGTVDGAALCGLAVLSVIQQVSHSWIPAACLSDGSLIYANAVCAAVAQITLQYRAGFLMTAGILIGLTVSLIHYIWTQYQNRQTERVSRL